MRCQRTTPYENSFSEDTVGKPLPFQTGSAPTALRVMFRVPGATAAGRCARHPKHLFEPRQRRSVCLIQLANAIKIGMTHVGFVAEHYSWCTTISPVSGQKYLPPRRSPARPSRAEDHRPK